MILFAGGRVDAARWRTLENLAVLRSTVSSNDLAREIIESYLEEDQDLRPSVIAAEEQTGARGRSGRWIAAAGQGLYFTYLLHASGLPLSVLPIATARWVREAIRESAGLAPDLKWPNDLYLGRRKLAGILSEARTQGDQAFVAVGVGLNVKGPAASVGLPRVTTLEEEGGKSVALAPLLQAILDRIDRELTRPHWGGEVAEWERASLHRPGDRITVRREGEETTGEYLGLDASGFLRLKTERGEAILPAGEVAEW